MQSNGCEVGCIILISFVTHITSRDCCYCSVLLLCVHTAFLCRYNLQQMNNADKWDGELLKHAVMRLVPALTNVDCLYDVDCRALLPPKLPFMEGMHTGCHPALFKRVVCHPTFAINLKSIQGAMEDDRDMKRKSMALLVCDVNGRHAAMAFGKAFAECIVADPHYSLGIVHILTNQVTGNSCGVCARCEFWTRRWASRNSAVKAVKDLWFDLAQEVVLPD
jgi:hypothetical protein